MESTVALPSYPDMTLPSAPHNPGKLNPSLSVEGYFLVQFPGEVRRTQLKLRDYPEVAAWLLSFLDHLLFKQGTVQGERRIAAPPGGAALQALIRGGVILGEQRPGGGLALRLNPDLGEMGLYLYARLRHRPAMDTAFSLLQDPDLSRWLLTWHQQGEPAIEPAGLPDTLADTLADTLVESLRRYGVLVDELPADEVFFPDPDAPADLAPEMAAMSAIFLQPVGQRIPDEALQILGRNVPPVPPDTALIWGQDAGTGLVFPALCGVGDQALDSGRFTGALAVQRAAQWNRQREVARESMQNRRYAVLREILPAAQRVRLRHYVRQLADRGYFPSVGLDKQVELRRSMYRQPTIASLHNGLARLLSTVYGQPLIGSFNQLGLYEAGAVLEKHTDRPQCVLNLSLVLDMSAPQGEPEPWPIYIEMNGRTEAIHLQVGDGLAYSGVEVLHWRDPLPAGQRAIVGFFFFVPPDFSGSLD